MKHKDVPEAEAQESTPITLDAVPNAHDFNVRFDRMSKLIAKVAGHRIIVPWQFTASSIYSQKQVNVNFDSLLDKLEEHIRNN